MLNSTFLTLIAYFISFIVIGFFLYKKPTYRQNVSYILWNISLLYKNYIHWSFSKLVIYIYWWLLAIVASMPFLAIMIYLLYQTSWIIKPEWISTYFTNGSIDYWIVTALLQHPFLIGFAILILIMLFVVFISSFMYAYILQQKIYMAYLEWKKLPYISKNFFNWRLMLKYLWVIFWIAAYLLIPLGLAVLYILILFLLSKIEALKPFIYWENLVVWIFQMIVFASFFIYFIYMALRLSFSYICLLYSTDSKRKAHSYIKESLAITKWKILKLIGLGIPFLLVSIILDSLFWYLESLSSYMPYAMNIVDFFVLSGMSLMIYLSFYRILIWKTINTAENLETIIENETVTEQKDIDILPKELPKNPIKKPKTKTIKTKK